MTHSHGWKCLQCYTGNEPDYEYCQECGADIDGNYNPDRVHDAGYEAWHADIPLKACPYPDDNDAAQIWRDAWLLSQSENSQFGVGA